MREPGDISPDVANTVSEGGFAFFFFISLYNVSEVFLVQCFPSGLACIA